MSRCFRKNYNNKSHELGGGKRGEHPILLLPSDNSTPGEFDSVDIYALLSTAVLPYAIKKILQILGLENCP